MSDSLPPRTAFNFEFLRKEAKGLVRGCWNRDRAAIARVRANLSRLSAQPDDVVASAFTLADAHQLLAHELGCSAWADVKRHGNVLDRFLMDVRGGAYVSIAAELAGCAPLAEVSVHAACALGDRAALDRHVTRDPSIVGALHREWSPLMYACASPLHRLSMRHAEGLLDCAESLLDRGADPNAASPGADGARISAMRRAQLAGNFPITLLLLERKATPEGLAFSHGHGHGVDPRWRQVFQDFQSARPNAAATRIEELWRQAVARPPARPNARTIFRVTPEASAADAAALWSMPAMPTAGAAGDAGILLGIALSYPPPLVSMLVDRGFDINMCMPDGRSVLAAATRAGRSEAAHILRAHAESRDVSDVDQLIGACLALNGARASALARADATLFQRFTREDFEVLLRVSTAGSLPHVRVMLDSHWPIAGRGHSGATALHVAAWRGHVEVVRCLLERGAPTGIRDTVYGETPLEWATHGSLHGREAPEDYRDVIAMLTR